MASDRVIEPVRLAILFCSKGEPCAKCGELRTIEIEFALRDDEDEAMGLYLCRTHLMSWLDFFYWDDDALKRTWVVDDEDEWRTGE